jgi:ribosomal protein L33
MRSHILTTITTHRHHRLLLKHISRPVVISLRSSSSTRSIYGQSVNSRLGTERLSSLSNYSFKVQQKTNWGCLELLLQLLLSARTENAKLSRMANWRCSMVTLALMSNDILIGLLFGQENFSDFL